MSFQLPAELTKHNVSKCLKDISRYSTALKQQSIRLESITRIDSAGIAFLLELQNKYGALLIEPSPVIVRLANLYQIKLGS